MTRPAISGLSQMIDDYQGFLVDAWGVLHDGKSLYPGACEWLQRLIAADKKVIILSNAARRVAAFRTELERLNIGPALYTDALTSGELFWRALRLRSEAVLCGVGQRYYYQGPKRSHAVLDGLDIEQVASLGQAEFIVNTGAEGNLPDAGSFDSLLREARALGLPMLCVNPDRMAIRGGVLGISAGAIAHAYEQLGAKVVYFGKPHRPIFEACFERFPDIDRRAWVMLGDGLPTDILGANQAGIDSILLTSGIHHSALNGPAAVPLETLFDQYQARPSYVITDLTRL